MGSLVTRISGKVGGQTFGTSSTGSYIRNTGTPRKAITLAQRSKMSLMSTTSQSWRALTQSQRNVFIAASPEYTYLNRVGETKNYSGYAIYNMLKNNVVNTFSESISPAIPVPLPRFSFTPLTSITFASYEGDLEINALSAQPGVSYRFFMTKILSAGISAGYKNKYYMHSDPTHMAGVLNINIYNPYFTKWGQPPATGVFYWKIDAVHLATGQILKGLHSGSEAYSNS